MLNGEGRTEMIFRLTANVLSGAPPVSADAGFLRQTSPARCIVNAAQALDGFLNDG